MRTSPSDAHARPAWPRATLWILRRCSVEAALLAARRDDGPHLAATATSHGPSSGTSTAACVKRRLLRLRGAPGRLALRQGHAR